MRLRNLDERERGRERGYYVRQLQFIVTAGSFFVTFQSRRFCALRNRPAPNTELKCLRNTLNGPAEVQKLDPARAREKDNLTLP